MYKLAASALRFSGQSKNVSLSKDNIQPGMVCCVSKDKCPDMNMFVIIDSQEIGEDELAPYDDYVQPGQPEYYVSGTKYITQLTVISPRIRIINDEFVLGQDKHTEPKLPEIKHSSHCQLERPNQDYSLYCTCGVKDQFKSKRMKQMVVHSLNCKFEEMRQNYSFYCTCGAEENAIKEYGKTFVPKLNNEGSYQFSFFKWDDYQYKIKLVAKDEINKLDYHGFSKSRTEIQYKDEY